MKSFIAWMMAFTALVVGIYVFANLTKIQAGYVGVKVHLLGTSKGVNVEELGVGRHWIGFNEDLFIFPTFLQNEVWTKNVREGSANDESITFQTMQGMQVGADVGLSYSVKKDKVTDIFQKYRKGIDEITDIYLRNMVRDAFVTEASTRKIEDIYGAGKTAFMAAVLKSVRDQTSDLFNIEKIYLIGSLRLPSIVTKALEAKMAATQRAQERQNEVAMAKAEADKEIEDARGKAESINLVAKAEAAALELKAEVLANSPALVQYEAIQKWDGVLPQVSGGGVIPMINLKIGKTQ